MSLSSIFVRKVAEGRQTRSDGGVKGRGGRQTKTSDGGVNIRGSRQTRKSDGVKNEQRRDPV